MDTNSEGQAVPTPLLIERLSSVVGKANCLSRREELFTYGCDGLTLDAHLPSAVVLPKTSDEVAEVVAICREQGRSFVPRGAGTGLSGGATPLDGAVVICCSRMQEILEIDAENRIAVLQPGVVNAHLSEAVAHLGLFYAPDPSSQQACTIGGNVAENSGGPHTLKYGTTTNHVLAVEMVLPDASRVRLGSATGFAPGYDLVGVAVGSEGTLGIVTEITVRLVAIPEAVETILAIFDDVPGACRLVGGIIRSGMVPAALEVVDQRTIRAVEASVYAAGLPTDAGAVLIIELDGAACEMETLLGRIRVLAEAEGVRELRVARNAEERTLFWRARKGAFGAMGRLAPDLYVHDAVVPRASLPEVLEEICAIGDRYRLKLSNVFHAGDGNLHP
ncbi:MAG: FAD-binding protein, partial [Myxococcota bacterium]|nr:FAD-binding protein [Myxococcota bacterium]